jgi:hypothetical protein
MTTNLLRQLKVALFPSYDVHMALRPVKRNAPTKKITKQSDALVGALKQTVRS